jgi:asparagine synthetase B (glutamine-hydrolysing)
MAERLAAQCRQLLVDCASREATEHPCSPEQRCIILSGGVDTCCVLEACKLAGVAFGAAITVFTSETASDRTYACANAKQHGLTHHVVDVTLVQLMAQALPLCVQQLQTFDGMELRNSMVRGAADRAACAAPRTLPASESACAAAHDS